MSSHRDINGPKLFLWGFLGVVLTFATIILLLVVYHRFDVRERQVKVLDEPYTEISKLINDQQGRLNSYTWVDEQNKVARIPIDRAMQLVVADLAGAHKDGRTSR